eukprot:1697785-Heterocapsa_arctica.AAC.1
MEDALPPRVERRHRALRRHGGGWAAVPAGTGQVTCRAEARRCARVLPREGHQDRLPGQSCEHRRLGWQADVGD